jgi:histidinol-phosphatase (PHP family)
VIFCIHVEFYEERKIIAMIIDTDFHSHVSRTSALQMVEAAQDKGMRVFGLSEHVFEMSEARPLLDHLPMEGPLLPFDTYTEAVQRAAQNASIDVRLGLEVDFIPDKNERIQAFLQGRHWDFLIGSVHEVEGIQFERGNSWGKVRGEELWHRYYTLLREAVKSGYFSVISHPVRMRLANPHLPPTLDEELDRLAAEATRHDVALEINGSDVLRYPDLVQRLALACKRQETPISVGSDAHYPPGIAQAHVQTEVMLREVGISKVRIWKHMQAEEYSIETL